MARRKKRGKKQTKTKKRPRKQLLPQPKLPEAFGISKKEALIPSTFKREQIKARRILQDYSSPFLLFHEQPIPSGP
jgi:hypothetical protein